MSTLSDKWIKNGKNQKNYKSFVPKQTRKGKYHMDFHLTVMMQEFLTILNLYKCKFHNC